MEESFIKITGAAYKMLDFLPDHDPLKNKAKEKVIAILDALALMPQHSAQGGWLSLQNLMSGEQAAAALRVVEDITVLENYLSLARSMGWMSDVNFFIISKSYADIKEKMREYKLPVVPPSRKASVGEERKPEVVRPITIKKDIAPQDELSARQHKILKILARKKKAQVQDIIKEMPDVTKRTVRRDLDDLLKRGQVDRTGEFNQVVYLLS